ncbi:MAG: toprim domain-containing protein [Gammaproteobacteria bacterium]|nr:toprim domain-containing protein [Gammaproteobacteria bacterium]
MDEKATRWIEARGIDSEIATRFGIKSFQKSGKSWISIPFLEDGEPVNHKFRCIEEKAFYQEPDGKKCFWNVDVLHDKTLFDQPVVITEGEFDAISAIQSGFVRTISVPDGAPAKPVEGDSAKYDYLDKSVAAIRNSPFVVIAADGDQPGANLLHDLSLRIGREHCKWVAYPKGCKDLNDALKAYGQRGVVETINRAQWLKLDGVYKMSELPPLAERAIYKTDFHMNIRLGDFTVVTGIPGHGKSTWVNDLCCRLATQHGLKTAFASFEQHPRQDHLRNLRKWFIKGNHRWTAQEMSAADAWIEKHFSFIYPTEAQSEEEDISLPWLLEKCAASVVRHGANVIVVDPWNELDHVRRRDQTMTDYVSEAIKRFKQFARLYNVHLIIVAHPTKLKAEKDGRLSRPTLYDISDSANWANKADLGIVIYKDGTATHLDLQKSRYHEILGKPASAEYSFNPIINRFEYVEI